MLVANGLQPGFESDFPPAARMMKLKYSKEQAFMASLQVNFIQFNFMSIMFASKI
jgi:hypothetical protein